ncbi:coiled-coil domain-containing protein 180 isoform X2 [Trematomus bernacchii]|uniref:coiled-coil domain-containing protein 180 isoform X2 n=1 Tax=Trematomus bernacchii TaxID=40690 RepID=UPI00146D43F7|nr:coiled-coil domain-containing protein 180 isoform X2 [Trematomus bernacchii]
MCESRAVPSGKVYRQLFDAQVQLSRSLLAGRRDTDCLSAEDSNTTSRMLCPLSSRGQQVDDEDDEDVEDVSRLPDSVVVNFPSSDIIERLTEKKSQKHKEALKQLETELTHLTQVCETQVRYVSVELLSSLQDVYLRLKSLKDRMEHLEHDSVQEVCVLWEQVERQVKLKEIRIQELNHKLTESETQRTAEIRAVLRKYLHLLQKISYLPPPDVCRLIHTEATMLNQSLLSNRRSVARLLLRLQEENLQQENLLRLHWEESLDRWRRSRVTQVIDRFRALCSSEGEPLLQKLKPDLTKHREDMVYRICFLVPPSCSTVLVSDWFNQLSAINQQIDALHTDFLHQLRCCYEQQWQDGLAEVERCEEALSALQLSEQEVSDIINSQLLTLIGQSQSQVEERLAALERCSDSATCRALALTRCVFVVMRGAALLWETHSRRLETREEEIKQHLEDLRRSQQRNTQRRKVHLDDLLGALRQGSSEDNLRTNLERCVLYLQDIKHSCTQCVSDQGEVLERLPPLLLEELLSYSSSISSFFHLGHTYTPSPEELQTLLPSSSAPPTPEANDGAETTKPENHPISDQNDTDPAQPSQDWLTEADSSLIDFCDISSFVTFTSARGVAYSGPAFRCPAPDLQQETQLSLFPAELLTHALSRTRTLFLDHLEQRFHDVLSSAVAMMTERKEAVLTEQEVLMQQLHPRHIKTHIYLPRLAELQLHRQQVDAHCEEVEEVLSSCRVELQELQSSVRRRNQQLSVRLSNMEEHVLSADSSSNGNTLLQAVSSTLQDCLDEHIKHTQRCQTSCRQTVQSRLQEVRSRAAHLLTGFRLFSEGGDFAPQEVKVFQRRLKEETKQINATEESISSELEAFESHSLQQLKEASGSLEEKLSLLKSEMGFMEKIQKIIGSTQVHIKAEAASSNQQQSAISSRLEDLRRLLENKQEHTQVSPDQVLSLLSSVNEEVRKRCQYLDISLEGLSARPKSRKPVHSARPLGELQTSRSGVDLLWDPVVDVIRSLNRFCEDQDCGGAEEAEGGRPAAGQSPLQRKCTESVMAPSVRRGCRSNMTERTFQVYRPEPELNPHSFPSALNCVLWRANNVLLQVAEGFYQSERLSRFLLVPDSFDQWAESMQQRLLGYHEQSRTLLRTSREEVVSQLSVLEELLPSFAAVLISNHEQRQGAGLREEMGGVRLKLKDTLAASEEEKRVNVRQLRASLRDEDLQSLSIREKLRQQRLHSNICTKHLELQVCLRVRGEEFVTSLASLTEQLLSQLDNQPIPEVTEAAAPHMRSDVGTVTMETSSRVWPGIPYLPAPTSCTPESPSTVTTATTAAITTSRCTLGHLAVIEQRDAAVKRFEQLFRSEVSLLDNDQRRRLSELQIWITHWRQQIHTLTHTL